MKTLNTLALTALLTLAACGGGEPPAADAPAADAPAADAEKAEAPAPQNADATKAATIAKAIKANPEGAADVLKENGISEEDFEALLYKVAADPAASAQYATALGN